MAYFSMDLERDNQIIDAGGFWCKACLVGKPLDDRSPDPRYCLGCYEVLCQEADLLTDRGYTKRPDWWPVRKKAEIKKIVPQDVSIIMQTSNDKKNKVCIIQPAETSRPTPKRGPKFKDLPVELINQWASDEGMGSKAIVTRLKKEFDIMIHYSTIQRMLSGQRGLL